MLAPPEPPPPRRFRPGAGAGHRRARRRRTRCAIPPIGRAATPTEAGGLAPRHLMGGGAQPAGARLVSRLQNWLEGVDSLGGAAAFHRGLVLSAAARRYAETAPLDFGRPQPSDRGDPVGDGRGLRARSSRQRRRRSAAPRLQPGLSGPRRQVRPIESHRAPARGFAPLPAETDRPELLLGFSHGPAQHLDLLVQTLTRGDGSRWLGQVPCLRLERRGDGDVGVVWLNDPVLRRCSAR